MSIGCCKCKNAVCQQRMKFMDSLAYLLLKMATISKTDAFEPIQTAQWTLKGDIPKVSEPFEIIPADSFGLDVDPKIKSEKEAKKEQLSKLTTENKELMAENEDLKSKLKEKSDKEDALFNIMGNCRGEDTEVWEKENKALKQKLAELEEKNKEKDEEIEKLKKYDAQSNELFQTAYSDNDKLRKELEEKNKEINDQKLKYQILLGEIEKIRQEKDDEINAQKRENRDLGDENFLLEFENKVLKNRPKNEDDEKKNSKDKKSEKLPKKLTDPKTIKEVDDFRKRLKEAGDNLRKLELLQDELKNKPHLKKWVSDELEEAVKNAKESKKLEEKRKKEAEEAKKEMDDLMRSLKNTEDVEQLKNGIAALLNYAQKRLTTGADKFGLEDAESFVKKIGDVYGNDVRQIAQRLTATSFVNTVSSVQENIMEVWKKMTMILKPKALPKEVLEKATADEEEKRIKDEVARRVTIKTRAVVQEKDEEIAVLKKQLEQMERKLKQQASDAKIKQHMRGKTEINLSSKANGSPLYNLTEISDVRDEESCDNGRYSTPCETPGTNKLRNRYARNGDNYSRDDSRRRSFIHSKSFPVALFI